MNWFRDHDPQFLATLRRAARTRAESRRIKLRRSKWNWRRYLKVEGLVGFTLLACVGLALSRQSSGPDSLNPAAVEAVVTLVSLFLVVFLERQFTGMLNYWPDLAPALRLPASDGWIVRRQWGRGLERFPLILLAAFLGALSVSLFSFPGWGILVGCLLFAVALSTVVLVMATWVAGTQFGGILSAGLWGSLVFLWIGSKVFPELKHWLVLAMNQYGEGVTLIVPTGWVVRPFHRALWGGTSVVWISLVPALVLVASGTTALARLPGRLRIRDQALLHYAAQIPDDATDEFRRAVAESLTLPAPASLGNLRAKVLDRSFLNSFPVSGGSGWIERLVWRCWSSSERQIAGIAFVPLPHWTKNYATCSGLLLLSIGASAVGAWMNIGWLLVGWVVAGGVLAWSLTPLSPAVGRLANSWEVGPGTVSALGLFPMSFRELCQWSLKATRIRLLLGTPLAILTGATLGLVHPDLISVRSGVAVTVVALFSVLGLQPLWLAGTLLGRNWPTFVGRRRYWREFVWLTVGIAWLGLSAAGVTMAVMDGFGWGIGCAMAAAATGIAGLRWIGGVVGSGGIELVVRPQEEFL